MRTTININEHVLSAAKDAARAAGITLGEHIERALQGQHRREPGSSPAPLPTSAGQPAAGLDVTSNQQLYSILDDGVALDRLR